MEEPVSWPNVPPGRRENVAEVAPNTAGSLFAEQCVQARFGLLAQSLHLTFSFFCGKAGVICRLIRGGARVAGDLPGLVGALQRQSLLLRCAAGVDVEKVRHALELLRPFVAEQLADFFGRCRAV